MNVTYKQRDILLNCLKQHPEIIRGRISRKSESRKELKDIWEEIANKLNSSGEGPVKTVQEWIKSWSDWKMYVLKKETNRRRNARSTGGGPPKIVNFTDLEQQLLEILTPEAAGMANIPQAGFQSKKETNVSNEEILGHKRILQDETMDDLEIIDNYETFNKENSNVGSMENWPIYYEDVDNSTTYTCSNNPFKADNKENASCESERKRKIRLLQNPLSKVVNCSYPSTTTARNCDNSTKSESLDEKKVKADCSYNRFEIKQKKKKNEVKEPLVLPEKIKPLNEISQLMLRVQEQTLELYREEVQVKQDTLETQKGILQELKEMKELLRNYTYISNVESDEFS